MFDEIFDICKGIIVLAITWFMIIKIADGIQNSSWVTRKQLQRAFLRAQNSVPVNINVRTYSVIFNDGKSQETRFLPQEIDGWVTKYNAEATGDGASYRIVQVLDDQGKIIWEVTHDDISP